MISRRTLDDGASPGMPQHIRAVYQMRDMGRLSDECVRADIAVAWSEDTSSVVPKSQNLAHAEGRLRLRR